jgi:excisionase family DNA binding protein
MPNTEAKPALLTISQVAMTLGRDPRTIRRAIRAEQLPAITIGARILIPRTALLELLDRAANQAAIVETAPVVDV